MRRNEYYVAFAIEPDDLDVQDDLDYLEDWLRLATEANDGQGRYISWEIVLKSARLNTGHELTD